MNETLHLPLEKSPCTSRGHLGYSGGPTSSCCTSKASSFTCFVYRTHLIPYSHLGYIVGRVPASGYHSLEIEMTYTVCWPPTHQPELETVTTENMQGLAPAIENYIYFELAGLYFAYLNSVGNPDRIKPVVDCHFPIQETLTDQMKENILQKRRDNIREADQALIQILLSLYKKCDGRI
eukprot:356171-Hanusia_phi.AAC.1